MASARIVWYKDEWMGVTAASKMSGLTPQLINKRCRKYKPATVRQWTLVFAKIMSQAEYAKIRPMIPEYRICPKLYNQFMEAFR